MTMTADHNATEYYQARRPVRDVRGIMILDAGGVLKRLDLSGSGRNEFRFGRGTNEDGVDIRIDSPIVSRRHGRLYLEHGRWFVEDMGSRNGTMLNGAMIKWHVLSDGDIIRIGGRGDMSNENGVLMLVTSDTAGTGWRRIPLDRDRLSIGRGRDNDLVLPSITVSRRHAVLLRGPNGWTLRNEMSANGVLVNESQVTDRCLLHNKDVICITDTRIIFTDRGLWMRASTGGVEVNARGVVVKRRRGQKSFITNDHVNFQVSPGELVAIIGGSGAGKSTLMNVLCGYLKPSEGRVLINGTDLYRNFNAIKNLFGYVPQSDIVYNNLTLSDMLRYAAELRLPKDTTPEEREKTIDSAIRMVELTEQKNSLIRRLSGGQRKRASIAVELLSDPKLLFLDEPASGLDPATERSLMLSLKRMAQAGKTVILVTHSTLQLGLCDKVAFMGKGGRLCFMGSEREALAFFGKSNVIDIYAEINDNADEWRRRYDKDHGPLQEPREARGSRDRQRKARFHQLRVLCARYIRLVLNDRQRLILLLAQAPLLAALISLVADGNQFEQYEMTKSLLFALSCSAFWIGMLNSIQEICKERTVLKREYMTGLSLSAYVLSKAVVLGILCLVQSVLLVGVFAAMVGLPEEGLILPPVLELFVSVWLTSVSAAALGLFVSALFNNPDRAMTVAPLMLMPQMLFSGLLFTLSGATEMISYLATCRWSMEGLGTTSDLNGLELKLQQQGLPIEHKAEEFFEYTAGHLAHAWLILAGFAAGFLILACLLLRRLKQSEG